MNKNHPEQKRFIRRSLICAAGVFLLFFILFLRLVYLQIFKHDFYKTLSDRNIINIVPIPSSRGLIYDRNGVLLAKNVPVYNLMITPERVKNLKNTVESVQKIIKLSPDEIKIFYHNVKQFYASQPVPLKQALSESEVAKFYVNQYHLPGVSIQTDMMREYPLGKTTSNIVGYIGRITAKELGQADPTNYTSADMIGKAGVELEDEALLHGTMGAEEAEIDANGKIIRILKKTKPISGSNLYLTIDSKLQLYAQKLLGKNNGSIVAIQPQTGQVLALVTNPGYDPNLFTQGMTSKQYHDLITNPNHPLFNRAIHATYAPGSVVKPFVAFSALNNGTITAQDSIFDPGWYQVPNTKHIFHNWLRTGFGWVNVIKAITVSCDTFFYQLAVTLGIDRLDQALTQFGFGELTGIDLPGERAGIVPTPDWKEKNIGQPWYTGDTVVAGIGQGYVTATPLQMANATAIIANRGLKYQPTVLRQLEQPNGQATIMQPIAETPINTTNPKDWKTVIHAMQQVVDSRYGTAHRTFLNATYTAAGKTGTAQVRANDGDEQKTNSKEPKRLQNNHLFICFAPVDHPQIAIAVVVEHIHGMSQLAVQITRQLLDFYFNEQKELQAKKTAEIAAQPAIPAPQQQATPTLPQPSNSLPAPQQQIQHELKTDLQTEVAQSSNTKKPNDDNELQDQMDQDIDTQVEMQIHNQT